MSALETRINEALSPLIGLPIWRSHRTMNLQVLHFGSRHKAIAYKGEEVEVGDFALHVSCVWRIIGPAGIVVASRDRYYPADEESDWQLFDQENDPTLLEAKMAPWLEQYQEHPLRVEHIQCDAVGGFEMRFEHAYTLQVFPADSMVGRYSEHWRLLRPGGDEPHFVVKGYGIEE